MEALDRKPEGERFDSPTLSQNAKGWATPGRRYDKGWATA